MSSDSGNESNRSFKIGETDTSSWDDLLRVHMLLFTECDHVKEISELLERGAAPLRRVLHEFPDKESLDCELRNVLHVTLREIKDNFKAEELCLIFMGNGMSGFDCNRDITHRNASDYAISRDMTRLWKLFQFHPSVEEIKDAFETHRVAKIDHFSDLLRKSIRENKVEMIDKCIENGADPNQPNKNGFTSLHFAAAKSSNTCKYAIMEKLIEAGADVNVQDKEGNTALNLFIKRVDDEEKSSLDDKAIELLVLSGTDVTLQDSDGKDSKAIIDERGIENVDDILNLKPTKIRKRRSSLAKETVKRIIVKRTFIDKKKSFLAPNSGEDQVDFNSNILTPENVIREDDDDKEVVKEMLASENEAEDVVVEGGKQEVRSNESVVDEVDEVDGTDDQNQGRGNTTERSSIPEVKESTCCVIL